VRNHEIGPEIVKHGSKCTTIIEPKCTSDFRRISPWIVC